MPLSSWVEVSTALGMTWYRISCSKGLTQSNLTNRVLSQGNLGCEHACTATAATSGFRHIEGCEA